MLAGFQHAMMEVVGVESPACPTLFIPVATKHSPSETKAYISRSCSC